MTRCDGVSGADRRGGLAFPEGRGAQETEQRGETSLWEDGRGGLEKEAAEGLPSTMRRSWEAGESWDSRRKKNTHMHVMWPGWTPPVRGRLLGADKLSRQPDTDGCSGTGYSVGPVPPISLPPRASNGPGTRLGRRENSTFPAPGPAKLHSADGTPYSSPLNSTNSTNLESWHQKT